MAEKIRVGIIGVGQIGKTHVESYSKMSDVEIVAVADMNEAEAQRVAAQYGIKHAFKDFRDLLAIQEIQSVDVCLHNNLHAPVAIAAMEAGKNAMSEKPMAGSYADALAMYEASKRTGQRLGVMLRLICSKEGQAARRLIDAGELGELYYGRSHGFRRRGRPFVDGYGTANFVQKASASGGALYDMGVYHISLLLYLLGNTDVKTISGATHQMLDMHQGRRESSKYDVEELGLGHVRLGNNITLSVEESWAMHYDNSESSKVLGSKGGIKLDPFTFYSSAADMELSSSVNLDGVTFRLRSVDPNYEAFDSIERHWIATQQGRVEPIDTASIGLATMLISEGIYLSQKLGREVTADEVREHSVSTAIKL